MSFTNKTPNYDLPQYTATDKPTYLVDANGAYLAIDTAMKANETAAAAAQSAADGNTTAINTLNGQVNDPGGIAARVSDVETLASTTAGNVNTINSLIGNGEPTTTDKTLIGAINELDAGKVSKGNVLKVKAEGVTATVTADGVKTFNDLLAELTTAINESMTDTDLINFTYFASPSINCAVAAGPIKKSASYELHGVRINSSTILLSRIQIGTTAANCFGYLASVLSSPIAVTDIGITVPANDATLSVTYNVYELV